MITPHQNQLFTFATLNDTELSGKYCHQTKSELKKQYGDYYSSLYDLTKERIFLKRWLEILKEKKDSILAMKKGIGFALSVKELLDIKDELLLQFYFNPPPRLEVFILIKIVSSKQQSAKEILEMLRIKCAEFKNEILKIENKLKDYGWLNGIASVAIRLFSRNYAFRFIKNDMIKNSHVLETTATSWAAIMSIIVQGGIFYISKLCGIPHLAVNMVCGHIIPSSAYFTGNKAALLKNLPVLNSIRNSISLELCRIIPNFINNNT